jgi:hypothetical protein
MLVSRDACLTRPGIPLDELNVAEAVLGDGLVLVEDHAADQLEIHRIDSGRAIVLGVFEDAADAWRALDELDDPLRVS